VKDNLLLVEVQSEGKVLPGVLIHGRGPDLFVLAVHHFERVLGQALLVDHGASLEHDLVRRVITSLVPDILRVSRCVSEKKNSLDLHRPTDPF